MGEEIRKSIRGSLFWGRELGISGMCTKAIKQIEHLKKPKRRRLDTVAFFSNSVVAQFPLVFFAVVYNEVSVWHQRRRRSLEATALMASPPPPPSPFPLFPFPQGELIDLGEVRRWQRSEENPQKRGKQLLHRSRVRASWLHFSYKGNRSVPYVTAKLSGAAKCGRGGEKERGNFHKIDPSKSQRHNKRVGERDEASSFF